MSGLNRMFSRNSFRWPLVVYGLLLLVIICKLGFAFHHYMNPYSGLTPLQQMRYASDESYKEYVIRYRINIDEQRSRTKQGYRMAVTDENGNAIDTQPPLLIREQYYVPSDDQIRNRRLKILNTLEIQQRQIAVKNIQIFTAYLLLAITPLLIYLIKFRLVKNREL